MSVKAMSLVWDLECPKTYGGLDFRPTHKFTLLAYADHADHHGKSIYPAISTVAKKTGLDDRTVQRLTRDLVTIGLLVDDGEGPRGTRRWKMPFDDRGWHTATPTARQGDKTKESLGDIPSGDIPSGDTPPPELKEPEPNQIISINNISNVWGDTKEKIKDGIKRVDFQTWVQTTEVIRLDDRTLIVMAGNGRARTWLDKNIKTKVQEILGLYVKFITVAELELELEEVTK